MTYAVQSTTAVVGNDLFLLVPEADIPDQPLGNLPRCHTTNSVALCVGRCERTVQAARRRSSGHPLGQPTETTAPST